MGQRMGLGFPFDCLAGGSVPRIIIVIICRASGGRVVRSAGKGLQGSISTPQLSPSTAPFPMPTRSGRQSPLGIQLRIQLAVDTRIAAVHVVQMAN